MVLNLTRKRVGAICAALVLVSGVAMVAFDVSAQTKPAAPAAPATKPAAPVAPPANANAAQPASDSSWAVNCTAANRSDVLNCSVEQKMVARETGQLVTGISVRIPGNTRQPVIVMQLPFGLSFSSGLKAQIDQGAATNLTVETCEPTGCFVIMNAPKAMLDAMASGTSLEILGTTASKEPFRVSHPLSGFKAAFESIK